MTRKYIEKQLQKDINYLREKQEEYHEENIKQHEEIRIILAKVTQALDGNGTIGLKKQVKINTDRINKFIGALMLLNFLLGAGFIWIILM